MSGDNYLQQSTGGACSSDAADAVNTMTHQTGSRQELVHVKLVQILIPALPAPHWVSAGQFYSTTTTGSIVTIVSDKSYLWLLLFVFQCFIQMISKLCLSL